MMFIFYVVDYISFMVRYPHDISLCALMMLSLKTFFVRFTSLSRPNLVPLLDCSSKSSHMSRDSKSIYKAPFDILYLSWSKFLSLLEQDSISKYCFELLFLEGHMKLSFLRFGTWGVISLGWSWDNPLVARMIGSNLQLEVWDLWLLHK